MQAGVTALTRWHVWVEQGVRVNEELVELVLIHETRRIRVRGPEHQLQPVVDAAGREDRDTRNEFLDADATRRVRVESVKKLSE